MSSYIFLTKDNLESLNLCLNIDDKIEYMFSSEDCLIVMHMDGNDMFSTHYIYQEKRYQFIVASYVYGM